MLDVFFHVGNVDEVTLGRADPLDSFNSSLGEVSLVIWKSCPAVEKAHLECIALFIDHILDLTVQFTGFYDTIVLEDDCIFQTLIFAPLIKFHVTEIAADSSAVEISDIRFQNVIIIVDLHTLFEIFRVNPVFELTSGLDISRVFPVDHLDRHALVMTREEILLPSCLIFHGQKKRLELVLRFLKNDVERQYEKDDERCHSTGKRYFISGRSGLKTRV